STRKRPCRARWRRLSRSASASWKSAFAEGIVLFRAMEGRIGAAVTALAETLAARTLELVDIPSESRDDGEIERYVAAAMPRELAYDGDSVLVYPPRRDGPFVV